LILAIWGGAVVGTIDNLLYPLLVGKRLKLPTVVALISAVGGLILFGPAGLVLGPVVLTITMALLDIWRDRAGAETVGQVEPDERSRPENEGGPEAPAPVRPHPRSPA
jgi:predicted PurR-regulated permease PerM